MFTLLNLVVVEAIKEDGVPSKDHRLAWHVDALGIGTLSMKGTRVGSSFYLCKSCSCNNNIKELFSEEHFGSISHSSVVSGMVPRDAKLHGFLE